jgi:fimbrial chaperone protein
MSQLSHAVDALQVLPTRVFLASQSSSELTLVNKGDIAGSYRIILRNIRTDDHGKFIHADKAQGDELFADKMIRFSPRQVTVEAGAFQKVRVMVRKPKDLKEGEYRTHIVFQSLPKQDANTLDENGDLSVSVDPVVEVSIPVIVRHGKLSTELEIQSPKLEKDKMVFTLGRKGTRSAYGDVEVVVNSGSDKDKRVSYIRGVSVYYPNPIRIMEVPLELPDNFNRTKDSLVVRFTEDPTYGGEHTVSKVYQP